MCMCAATAPLLVWGWNWFKWEKIKSDLAHNNNNNNRRWSCNGLQLYTVIVWNARVLMRRGWLQLKPYASDQIQLFRNLRKDSLKCEWSPSMFPRGSHKATLWSKSAATLRCSERRGPLRGGHLCMTFKTLETLQVHKKSRLFNYGWMSYMLLYCGSF